MTAGQKAAATRRANRARQTVHPIEYSAPVEFKSQACRTADETGLPMTVYYVRDRECAWFQVAHNYWGEDHAPKAGLTAQGIVTFLPSTYFRR